MFVVYEADVKSRYSPMTRAAFRISKLTDGQTPGLHRKISLQVRICVALLRAARPNERPMIVSIDSDALTSSMDKLHSWLEDLQIEVELVFILTTVLEFYDPRIDAVVSTSNVQFKQGIFGVVHVKSADRMAMWAVWVLLLTISDRRRNRSRSIELMAVNNRASSNGFISRA